MMRRSQNCKSFESREWRFWCRLCAKDDLQGNNNVFEVEQQQSVASDAKSLFKLTVTIRQHFGVKISHDDTLPKMLCTDCIPFLNSLITFSERVSKAQQMFEELETSANTTEINLHGMRLKYGFLNEDCEPMLMNQTVTTEVLYLKPKPKELEEHSLDTAVSNANPLEQLCSEFEIKQECMLEEVDNVNVGENQAAQNNLSCVGETCVEVEYQVENKTLTKNCTSDEHQQRRSSNRCRKGKESFVDQAKRVEDNSTTNGNEDNAFQRKIRGYLGKLHPKKGITKKCLKRKLGSAQQLEGNVDEPVVTQKKLQVRVRKKEFKCSQCPRVFPKIGQLNVHLKSHIPLDLRKIIPCPHCDKKFSAKGHMQRHIEYSHMERTFKCELCSRMFNLKRFLDNHMRSHVPLELRKVIPCTYCDTKFVTDESLQAHLKNIHTHTSSYVCEECGMVLKTKATLKDHMLRHTDDRPFECEVCKARFKNERRMKRHMHSHNPIEHTCPECGLRRGTIELLRRHMLVHAVQMRYKCDECGRGFKRSNAYKNHLLLHTGLRPFSCNFCERTFVTISKCGEHLKKKHTQELATLEAAGGGKAYTGSVPKLEALKAV